MADEHESSLHGRLRGTLDAAADGLVVEPVPSGGFAAAGASRRRRRHGFLAAGAATVLVGTVGLVVVNGNDPSTIETSPALETSTPTTEPTPAAVADDGADTPPVATAPENTEPSATIDEAADEAPAAMSFSSESTQVVPWNDGFLRIGFEYHAAPLPELGDDISALFPPEVADAFPDGLPGTVDEAMSALDAAGLLDEVSAILADNVEARDYILGQPVPPPTVTADFTTDGVEWTSTILDIPPIEAVQFTVSGDRLVAWGIDQSSGYEPGQPAADRPSSRTITLVSTTDLVDWQTVESDVPLPDDSRDYVYHDVWMSGVAVAGDRWVATLEQSSWVDWDSLLPDEVTEQMQWGGGWSTDADGVRVEVYDEDGAVTLTQYTWADLGLDHNPEEDFDYGRTTAIGGDFTGAGQMLDLPAEFRYGSVSSLGDRFLLSGDQVATSIDGTIWEPLAGFPAGLYITATAPVDGGYLLIADAGSSTGQQAWLRTSDGSISEITTPTLSEPYHLWGNQTSAAWIIEPTPEFDDADWEPVTVVVDYEGYRISLTDGPEGSSYVLTDAATDIEIQSEAAVGEDGYWYFDEETQESFVEIRDLTTDEVIVRIPQELVSRAYAELYEAEAGSNTEVIVEVGDEPATSPDEEWNPDLWLVATADGVNWVTRDLADPDATDAMWPQSAAINGNRLIYQTTDGWTVETI